MFLSKFNSPQVKRYKFLYNLPNKLRLLILGNSEIKRKSQNWVETKASIQPPFKILLFGNSGQNLRKNRYQSSLVLFGFAWFSYLLKIFFQWVQGLSNDLSKQGLRGHWIDVFNSIWRASTHSILNYWRSKENWRIEGLSQYQGIISGNIFISRWRFY